VAVDNFWDYNDFQNFRDAFMAKAGYVERVVTFRRFTGWKILNVEGPTIEQVPKAQYVQKRAHVWLSSVREFDSDRRGAFVAGDMDIHSTFRIRGRTPSLVLANGAKIDEYAGDEVVWNGIIWRVVDTIDPVVAGLPTGVVYFRTVMRRHDIATNQIVLDPTSQDQ
jgi:hypothetical protein